MAKNDEPLNEDEGTPVPTEPVEEDNSEMRKRYRQRIDAMKQSADAEIYPEPQDFPTAEEFAAGARPASYAPPEPQPKKRFGTGEPIYLYVKTSPGTYDNVGEFSSRVEASHTAESDWKGHQYKTLSASEAAAEQARLQARSERVQKTVKTVEKYATKATSGLMRVAKNVGRNAEGEARYHGMIHDRPAPPSQSVNVNVNTGEKGESVENLKRMGQQINRQYNPASKGFTGPDYNRQEQPAKRQFIVQKPGSRFSFVPPESPLKRSRREFVPPPTPLKPLRKDLNLPMPSNKKYGVRQQHGGVMFSDRIQVYRIPVNRLFGQREPVQQMNPKVISRHKTSKKFVKKRKR